MSYLTEVKNATKILINSGTKKNDIILLHCNSTYPALMREVNLNSMLTMKKKLNFKVGYSDHTLGIEIPIAAAALGAVVIEKHLTLDKNLKGPDHFSSLEPRDFKKMVDGVRNIEVALGNNTKAPSKSEMKNIIPVRKSIVASMKISRGEKFTEFNITTKRPSTGLSPMKWKKVLGKVAKKNYKKDELIKF